jgi:hypothetical protein
LNITVLLADLGNNNLFFRTNHGIGAGQAPEQIRMEYAGGAVRFGDEFFAEKSSCHF